LVSKFFENKILRDPLFEDPRPARLSAAFEIKKITPDPPPKPKTLGSARSKPNFILVQKSTPRGGRIQPTSLHPGYKG
jgi:hypothetical protein